MISKKLLKEVMSEEVMYVCTVIGSDEIDLSEYNIHEIAHKCKEWAWKQGYQIRSSYMSLTFENPHCDVIQKQGEDYVLMTNTGEDTEHESIFKACEWILKQKATHG